MLFFVIIQTTFFFLPLLFFFLFKRKNGEKVVRIILYYIIYCIGQEFLTYAFSFTPPLHPYLRYLFASFTIVEFGLFALFYYHLFPKEHNIKWVTLAATVGFISYALIDFFYIGQNQRIGSITVGIESLILILLCGYYLYYQVTTSMSMLVYRTFNFWVIVTFLMYVSSTFFLYLMTDTMGTDSQFQQYYLYINFGANLLKNLLLSFAMTRKVLSPVNKPKKEFSLDLGDDLVIQQNF